MANWTRRGFLTSVFAAPLAYWSGFWRGVGVKPLIYHPIKPTPGQIYLQWMAKEHARNIERAFLGLPFEAGKSFADAKARMVMMAMPEGQDDIVLGKVVKQCNLT